VKTKSFEIEHRPGKKKHISLNQPSFDVPAYRSSVEGIILFSLTPKIEHLIIRITIVKKEERLD
jgi:hypothetical protein